MAVYTKNMVALCLGSLVLMATLISSQAGEGVYGTHARTPLSVSIMIKLNNEEFHRDYFVVRICDFFFWMQLDVSSPTRTASRTTARNIARKVLEKM
jgi:hypothetical protein